MDACFDSEARVLNIAAKMWLRAAEPVTVMAGPVDSVSNELAARISSLPPLTVMLISGRTMTANNIAVRSLLRRIMAYY